MKKLLLILGVLMMVTSVTYAAEENTTSENGNTTSKSTTKDSKGTHSGAPISKGDSFMGAFGMGDSPIVSGGESGGGVTAGLTAVELSAAHVGSTSLTSSQNTPYSYK